MIAPLVVLAPWLGCSEPPVDARIAPPPPLADPDRIRLLALGDVGRGTETQRQVARGAAAACAERGCDAVLLLGDNLYPSGMESPDDPRADAWLRDLYEPIGAPVYLVLGNHDYARGRDVERAGWLVAWAARTDGFELPGPVWTTRAGPLRLIGLDTNRALQFGEAAQAAWLDEQLDDDARWTVVLGHHPLRSDGPHGNAGSYEGTRWLPWASGRSVERLLSVLCGRADLYLAGHDHSRQLLEHCGVPLVVSGAGGSATGIVDRGNQPRFAQGSPGGAWLELGPEEGRVVFLDADGREDGAFGLVP